MQNRPYRFKQTVVAISKSAYDVMRRLQIDVTHTQGPIDQDFLKSKSYKFAGKPSP